MLKERLSDPSTYYEVIERISSYLILLPRSRFRIADPLTHAFTDRQALELRFRRFAGELETGQPADRRRRPYLPKWLTDAEEAPRAGGAVILPDQNRVVVAPSAINAINMICRRVRTGGYAFSRLKSIAVLKNVRDRYEGLPGKSRLQLTEYRGLPSAEKEEYRLMVKPTFPDSLLLGALSGVLMRLFPADYFLPECCGYVPGRGGKEAVRQVVARLDEGHRIVLRVDVRSFNDTVPQGKLLGILRRRAGDAGWSGEDIDLLERLVANFFSRIDGVLGTPGIGIGMGTSLTPLFTNIYLDRLDRYLRGKNILFSRFGDDLALFFDDRLSAEQAFEEISGFVSRELEQEISEAKVTVADLRPPSKGRDEEVLPDSFDFCAYRFGRHAEDRAAVRIKDGTIAKIRRRIKLLTVVPKQRDEDGRVRPAEVSEQKAFAYVSRVIERISSLLGFFSTRAIKNGRVEVFFLVTGWPAAFLNDAASEEIRAQFSDLDRYILYRLRRLVEALGLDADEAAKFRERMRNMGLRTFMDAWNRHPRPYRY